MSADEIRLEMDTLCNRMTAMSEHITRVEKEVIAMREILQGRGQELGLVGKMAVLWKSYVAIIGIIGMAIGYVLGQVL